MNNTLSPSLLDSRRKGNNLLLTPQPNPRMLKRQYSNPNNNNNPDVSQKILRKHGTMTIEERHFPLESSRKKSIDRSLCEGSGLASDSRRLSISATIIQQSMEKIIGKMEDRNTPRIVIPRTIARQNYQVKSIQDLLGTDLINIGSKSDRRVSTQSMRSVRSGQSVEDRRLSGLKEDGGAYTESPSILNELANLSRRGSRNSRRTSGNSRKDSGISPLGSSEQYSPFTPKRSMVVGGNEGFSDVDRSNLRTDRLDSQRSARDNLITDVLETSIHDKEGSVKSNSLHEGGEDKQNESQIEDQTEKEV